ncbi:MAG: alpha/beta family hydrolase [Pseudomonadota bacterium]
MVSAVEKQLIRIRAGSAQLEGMLEMPEDAAGVVLFAHGSGSSRFSPRNNHVAGVLQNAGIATLLIDLLTEQEDRAAQARFDITLLTQRLDMAVDWLRQHEKTGAIPLGLFGASTGAAAALQVAALRGREIAAVVSRGGRPDLAGQRALQKVVAPTLLVVGGLDDVVIRLNRAAYADLHSVKRFEIVPGATHLFEEPGTLDAVAALARDWFLRHFSKPQQSERANE